MWVFHPREGSENDCKRTGAFCGWLASWLVGYNLITSFTKTYRVVMPNQTIYGSRHSNFTNIKYQIAFRIKISILICCISSISANSALMSGITKQCNALKNTKHVCCHHTLHASVKCGPDGRQTRREKKDRSQSNFNSVSISPQYTHYRQLSPEHSLSNPLHFGQRSLVALEGRETVSSRRLVVIKSKHPHHHRQLGWHHP